MVLKVSLLDNSPQYLSRSVYRTTNREVFRGLHLLPTLVHHHDMHYGLLWGSQIIEPFVVFLWIFRISVFSRSNSASPSQTQPRSVMKVTIYRKIYLKHNPFLLLFFNFLRKSDFSYTFNKHRKSYKTYLILVLVLIYQSSNVPRFCITSICVCRLN